jgi:hypothetical protein
MSEKRFTLKEDLYDRRDPKRPTVFVAGKGQTVTMHTATVFGLLSKSEAKRIEATDEVDPTLSDPKPGDLVFGGTPADEEESAADEPDAKAIKVEEVENKAIKPASTKSKK